MLDGWFGSNIAVVYMAQGVVTQQRATTFLVQLMERGFVFVIASAQSGIVIEWFGSVQKAVVVFKVVGWWDSWHFI